LGLDAETAAKSRDKRDGNDGDTNGNKDKEFVFDSFLEVGFDFFNQVPADADIFTKLVYKRTTAIVGNKINKAGANDSAKGVWEGDLGNNFPNGLKKGQTVLDKKGAAGHGNNR